jgi:hypothetical protein
VNSSYKEHIGKLCRNNFDCYGRNHNIKIVYKSEIYYANISQFCFFYWCFMNNIIEYVKKTRMKLFKIEKQEDESIYYINKIENFQNI